MRRRKNLYLRNGRWAQNCRRHARNHRFKFGVPRALALVSQPKAVEAGQVSVIARGHLQGVAVVPVFERLGSAYQARTVALSSSLSTASATTTVASPATVAPTTTKPKVFPNCCDQGSHPRINSNGDMGPNPSGTRGTSDALCLSAFSSSVIARVSRTEALYPSDMISYTKRGLVCSYLSFTDNSANVGFEYSSSIRV
jgi:hypothetical protein